MYRSAIAFDTTEDFREWLLAAVIEGPCSVFDRWTYGQILVYPDKGWMAVY